MLTGLISSALISILTRLITEKFLAKLVIEALRAWSRQTANDHDNRVVEAMAEAIGVDPVALKKAAE